MEMVSFSVPFVRGKGRVRFVRGTGRTYTPDRTAEAMELVRMATKIMMSAERLEAAVDNVILTHHYPTLTIADVLGFDVRLRLYSGTDVLRLRKEFPHPDFVPYTVDGVKYWVERAEAARLRVKLDGE